MAATTNGNTWTPPTGNSSLIGEMKLFTGAGNDSDSSNVKPNMGATVQDTQDKKSNTKLLAEWQKENNIDTSKQIKLVKIAHMRYQHPDLEEITRFLKDFGMHIAKQTDDKIWYRGYGTDPYCYYAQKGDKRFLGGTFLVESMDELEKAAKLPGATAISKLDDAPGGGYFLTVHDPEGFPINLMYGQDPVEKGDLPEKIIVNDETTKPRIRHFIRFTPGPAAVHKLGHFGLCIQDFAAVLNWYVHTFNLAPSDFIYVPTSSGATKDAAAFLHIDRHDTPVDHHSFFLHGGATSHVHHASFEVHDYDTQHLGHQWLGKQGYKSVWGIGRHILGSQIFDYWWDTTGNMIEHYADGDLVNHETPIGWTLAGSEALAVWGPEVPAWFTD